MIHYLKRLIPNPIKHSLKMPYHWAVDALSRFKHRNSMVPHRSKIYIGSGDFEAIGLEFRRYFIELAGLQSHHRVLDVGSGMGRMAIPLTEYLKAEGHGDKGCYCGFDIVKDGVDWCQSRITPKFKNFSFQHSDVFNKYYNAQGKWQAREYRFPFENSCFDFCFLTSVFTHMLPLDLENYVSEVARVLKVDGKCLITFFVLNDESKLHLERGDSSLDFRYPLDGCMTTEPNIPETAIAYEESQLREILSRHGLVIDQPIHFGSWCGRKNFLSYQDIIVAEKRP